jgi:hypothetical protein
MCSGLSIALPISLATDTSVFPGESLWPRFLAARYSMRVFEVSFMKRIATPTGAAMKRITHMENFQSLPY